MSLFITSLCFNFLRGEVFFIASVKHLLIDGIPPLDC
jgi:hypothetical protein